MAKAQRPSLSSYVTPAPAPTPARDNVVALDTAGPTPRTQKYPSVTVYLSAEEVRTLKLIGLDSHQRVSDICATAIRDWLASHGHARSQKHTA